MGWSSGSEVAQDMVKAINRHVPDAKTKRKLYRALIDTLESQDWDTQDEACGEDPIFDALIGLEGGEL